MTARIRYWHLAALMHGLQRILTKLRRPARAGRRIVRQQDQENLRADADPGAAKTSQELDDPEEKRGAEKSPTPKPSPTPEKSPSPSPRKRKKPPQVPLPRRRPSRVHPLRRRKKKTSPTPSPDSSPSAFAQEEETQIFSFARLRTGESPSPSSSPTATPEDRRNSQPTASASPSPKKKGAPATISASEISGYENYPENVRKIVDTALELTTRNLDYKYGSADPASGGMDCSGFVFYVLTQNGVRDVPRDSSQQYVWLRKAGTFKAVNSRQEDTFELDELVPGRSSFLDRHLQHRARSADHPCDDLSWPRKGNEPAHHGGRE